jgi:Niemann-Pick C1 protein
MNFMGGGAQNGQQWLEFLGEVKDKRVPPIGSPFQINFNPEKAAAAASGDNSSAAAAPPAEVTPVVEVLPGCGDPLFMCSCADCPVAPGCSAVS